MADCIIKNEINKVNICFKFAIRFLYAAICFSIDINKTLV